MKGLSFSLVNSENLGKFIFQRIENFSSFEERTEKEEVKTNNNESSPQILQKNEKYIPKVSSTFQGIPLEEVIEYENILRQREKENNEKFLEAQFPSDSVKVLYQRQDSIRVSSGNIKKIDLITSENKETEINAQDQGLYKCGRFVSDSILEKLLPEYMEKSNNNAWHFIGNNPDVFGLDIPEEFENVLDYYHHKGRELFENNENLWVCKNETPNPQETPWDIKRIQEHNESDLFEDWESLYTQLDHYLEDPSRNIDSVMGILNINNRNSPYGKDLLKEIKKDPYYIKKTATYKGLTVPASHIGFLGGPRKFPLSEGCSSIKEHFEKNHSLSEKEKQFLANRFGERWEKHLPEDERYYIDYAFFHQVSKVLKGSLLEVMVLLKKEGKNQYYPTLYAKIDDQILEEKGLLKDPEYVPPPKKIEVSTIAQFPSYVPSLPHKEKNINTSED